MEKEDYSNNIKDNKPDEILNEVMERFNAARAYTRKGFRDTWDMCRNLYNNKRVDTNYIGNSDTFVPETFTIVQSIKSNVIGGKISIDYLPTRQDQKGDLKVLKALMDQIWVQDKTKLKASWAVDDSLQTGNGYLWQYWKDEHPCNMYIPTEDNFFDTDATNYENLKWGGYRYITTKDELEKETKINIDYDPTNKKSKKRIARYKNLDRIEGYKKPNGKNDKTAKQLREEMISGSTIAGYDDEDLVEIIYYVDHEKVVRVANRCAVIEHIETPYKREKQMVQSVDDMGNPVMFELPEIKPFIPVAPARDYVDGAMWYAKGEVEVIAGVQELLNDTQSQKSDNLNYSLNRMWTLDPSYAHKIDEIQSVPGAVFTVPAGALQPINQTSVGMDADNEMFRLQGMMRRATAADEIVQGASVKGDATATEINATIMQAGTRFSTKLENFESEFFAILANNMLKIMQIFLTREQAVRMIGESGVEWKNYNPGEYLGNFDVKVSLEASAKVKKETEKQNAMQFFLLASKLPFVNQELLFRMTAKSLFDKDEKEIEQLLLQQMPMGMPQGGLMAPPAAPQGPSGPNPARGIPAQMPGAQMPQQGAGQMANMQMSNAERMQTNQAVQAQGINIPGMPS